MELIFPFNGVNKGSMKSAQPKGTAYQARNVVPIDSLDGRIRGGQRPGLKDLTTKGAVIDTLQTTNISPLTAVWTNNGRRFNVTNGNNISVNEYVKITARSQYEFDLKGTEVLHIKVITDGYNVDPNGGTATVGNVDSTVGLQAAITDGFGTAISSSNTIRGLAICNTIIDLEGGNYLISDELVIPTGASVKFINGAIVASATFTSGEYLIRNTGAISGTTTKTCVLKNAFITFENILLLGSGVANGVKMIGCDNFVFQNCHCQNYKDYGVYAWGDGGIHGFRAVNSVVNQYDWETVWNGTTRLVTPAGIGIYAGVYDSSISGCDVYLTGTGIVLARSSVNVFNTHPWGCTDLIKAEAEYGVDTVIKGIGLDGIYFDMGGAPNLANSAITVSGIWQDSYIVNSRFSRPDNAPTGVTKSTAFSFIRLMKNTGLTVQTGRADRCFIKQNVFEAASVGDIGIFTGTDYSYDGTGTVMDENAFYQVKSFGTTVSQDFVKAENASTTITYQIATATFTLVSFGTVISSGIEYNAYPDNCGGRITHESTGDLLKISEIIHNKYVMILGGNITIVTTGIVAGDEGTYYIPVKNTTTGAVTVTVDTETPLSIAAGEFTMLKVVITDVPATTVSKLTVSLAPAILEVRGVYYDGSAYSVDIDAAGTDGEAIDGNFRLKVVYG